MEQNEIRSQIDDIDADILKLFCKRMDVVRSVAKFKIDNDMPVLRPEREKEILKKVKEDGDNAGEGYGNYAERVFEVIMEVSRDMQNMIIEKETK